MDLFRLHGKRAYVVGGSKGLGESMALGLAQAGAQLAIASRDAPACDTVPHSMCMRDGRRSRRGYWWVPVPGVCLERVIERVA